MKNLCSTNMSQSIPYSSREKGFTLIEILIALAIMSIVTTAIYQLFINQQKTWVSQDLLTEMQQNSRVSIDTISRDLLMAGYGVTTAVETDSATTASNATQIAIRYKDPNDSNNIKRIMYWMDATKNVLYRKEDTASPNAESSLDSGSPGRAWSAGQPLADHVTALTFTYFNQNGDVLAMPPSGAYRIKVSLKVRTSRKDPVTLDWKYLILSTDARPRNIGIGGVASDTTPPEKPDPAPTLTDPHVCEKLDVSWGAVANAAGDLAGYVIYIGPAAGSYTQKVSVGNVTSYTLTGLDNATTYYIAIASRDKSGNESDYSTAASITLAADEPGQPVGLNATASSEDPPAVTLTWTSNATQYPTSALHVTGYGPDTDVGKYHVYRKTYGASDASWAKIGETDGTITTYSNALSEAEKCATFEYKIKAINGCNASKESSFSSSVYGDGAKTSFVDSPVNGASDTTASDGTKPAKPIITASKAGYRRDYLNWNNPSDGDLDAIVIRYYSTCGIVDPFASPATELLGTGVEEYPPDGLIPGEPPSAEGRTFTHNGTLSGTPNLGEGCADNIATYGYSLFAVDKCGNYSDKDDAAATTVAQCGEATPLDAERKICQEGAPTWSSSCNPVTESGFTVSNSCGGNYTFAWNRIDDSPDKIWDMAGYYIYRRLDTAAWTPSGADSKYTGLILNSTSPSWSDLHSAQGTDNDSSYAGNAYQYYVIPIDCNREINLSANPWSTVAVSPSPAPTASEVITVKPGRVTFGNNTSVTTGYLTATSPFSAPNYYHNTVDVKLKNTSAASVKLKSIRASWVNTSAYLNTIYKKNADGTWTAVWTAASPVASGTTVTFSTALGVQGVGDAANPWRLRFLFTASDGTVTQSQNMREDTVTVTNIEYDKIFTKGATEITPSCTITTPETVSVPLGPEFLATSHNKTSTEIVSSSLSPGYWVIGAGLDVNVFARVADSASVGIESVKLYYTTTVTPADPTTATPPALPYGNELPMFLISGTQYAIYNPTTLEGAKIPSNPSKTIWYYIIAKDNKGNFDMAPERQDGVYTYNQKSFTPCEVTPNPPTALTASAAGTTVTLNWTAPTEYTTASGGGAINTGTDPIKYRIYKTVSGTTTEIASDESVLTYSYSETGGNNVYSYYVKATNSCTSPGPNVSDPSNTAATCVGISGQATLAVSGTDKDGVTAGLQIYRGDSYTSTIVDCLAIDATHNTTTETLNLTSGFSTFSNTSNAGSYNPQVPETGPATGTFIANIGTTGDVSESGKLLVGVSDTITVSYTYAPTSKYVYVITDPCANTPKPPTGLGLSIVASPDTESQRRNSKVINITFTAPQFNSNDSELVDLSSYSLLVKRDGAEVGTVTIPLSTCTSSLSNPAAGATCTYSYTATEDMAAKVWSFEVRAVDSCSISSASVSKGETCRTGSGNCPKDY